VLVWEEEMNRHLVIYRFLGPFLLTVLVVCLRLVRGVDDEVDEAMRLLGRLFQWYWDQRVEESRLVEEGGS
jgi:hypothetical protein